jgi:hypothetical protein
MFFLQVDLTGGCLDTAPTRKCLRTRLTHTNFFTEQGSAEYEQAVEVSFIASVGTQHARRTSLT